MIYGTRSLIIPLIVKDYKLYFLRELGRRHGFELEEIFMPLVKMDDGSMNLTLAVEFWQALVFERHPHNRGIMAL